MLLHSRQLVTAAQATAPRRAAVVRCRASSQSTPPPSPPPQDASKTSSSSTTTTNSSSSSSDPVSALAFRGLAVTSLVAGGAAFVAPDLLTELAGAAISSDSVGSVGSAAAAPSLDATFCRIAGATLAISVAVESSLAEAAAAGRLASATYQRLLAALVPKNLLYVGALALTPAALSPLTAALYLPAPLFSLAAATRALLASSPANGADGGSGFANGFAALASAAFARPATAAGWGYLASALLYVFTLAACYAPEEALFTGGDAAAPLALLLKRTWAPGFWLAAAACLALRDAADRGRLGASTFRRLNWGVAALEAGYAATYASAIAAGLAAGGAPAASNLGGSVAIAAFAAWQAAFAARKE